MKLFLIGKTEQIFNKRTDGHFSDLLRLLTNRQKPDSFAAHFEQHFNFTTSCTDICKYMTFNVVKQLSQVCAIKTFTKPNCNLCIGGRLMTLKSYVINVSRVWTIIWTYTGPSGKNDFLLILPKHWWSRLTGERVRPYTVFQTLVFENVNGCFSTGNIFIGPTTLGK